MLVFKLPAQRAFGVVIFVVLTMHPKCAAVSTTPEEGLRPARTSKMPLPGSAFGGAARHTFGGRGTAVDPHSVATVFSPSGQVLLLPLNPRSNANALKATCGISLRE